MLEQNNNQLLGDRIEATLFENEDRVDLNLPTSELLSIPEAKVLSTEAARKVLEGVSTVEIDLGPVLAIGQLLEDMRKDHLDRNWSSQN